MGLSRGANQMAIKAKNWLASLHGHKTTAELATGYEIHPNSVLYRFCDWLGEKAGLVILTPHLAAVGNCAEDVYFGLLKARRESKKLFIVWPYELPGRLKFGLTNVEVINVGSEYRAFPHDSIVSIVCRILLTAYFGFFRSISLFRRLLIGTHLNNVYRIPIIGESTLWHPAQVPDFSWDIVNRYQWVKQLETPLDVYVEEKKRLEAEWQRVTMGIPKDAWFVCLHVRESGFRDSETYCERDAFGERNANIFNYIEAIKEITSRGGWVVRMGDRSMTKLPEMERVIDYPFTEFKSALMDVYLISQCRVYIGMMSGIYDVARLFQRPMIMTNMTNWLWTYPILRGDLGVAKHIFSKSKNRFLSLKEWIMEPWEGVSFSHKIGGDYLFHENTPAELRDVVKEFFDRSDRWEPSPLQCLFNEVRIRQGREILSNRLFYPNNVQSYYQKNSADYDLVERYRLASRLDSAVGVLGAKFVEVNWECDVKNSQLN
ncbi:MAG: TIGR04372 family glycosyltransferase [Rhodocyclaceae bacterium]|nr:TIGR04372 family glycosyltransferase [Rhodocyclaceae bacterium]